MARSKTTFGKRLYGYVNMAKNLLNIILVFGVTEKASVQAVKMAKSNITLKFAQITTNVNKKKGMVT